MSYTDYLKRAAINRPVVIDRQMRLPDASAYTNRVRLAASQIDRRHDHVINNSLDPSHVPNLFSKRIQNFSGVAFGGRNQDASSYTQSRGASAIGHDNFFAVDGSRKQVTNPAINGVPNCLTRAPASQIVSERGNSDENLAGLNMGYLRQRTSAGVVAEQVGECTRRFYPLTKTQFVDRIPDLLTHQIGSSPQLVATRTAGGRQVVQNPVLCPTDTITAKSSAVDSNGINLPTLKGDVPYNSYSAPPNNYIGSSPNRVHGAFVTGIQGPQTGGGNTPGSRAAIVGGVSVKPKPTITHRGWGGNSRTPYPHPRVPPNGAPAQLKINDPNHYKI